jgi:hypothetical protein
VNNPYYNFEAHICPDGFPFMTFEDDGREPGFFFSVENVPRDANLRFHFPKLSCQEKLLSYGHKPVYLKVSKERYE